MVAGGLAATLRSLAPKAQSAYVRLWKGWDWKETSAVTMVFEGSRQEAALQRSEVHFALCRIRSSSPLLVFCTRAFLMHFLFFFLE